MRFRLVKTGKTYGELHKDLLETAASDRAEPGHEIQLMDVSKPDTDIHSEAWETGEIPTICYTDNQNDTCYPPLPKDSNPMADFSSEKVFCRIKAWAEDDPKRWQDLRNTLLRLYAPVWERIDARDILVA